MEDPAGLDGALGEALGSDKPALVEVLVDPVKIIEKIRRV